MHLVVRNQVSVIGRCYAITNYSAKCLSFSQHALSQQLCKPESNLRCVPTILLLLSCYLVCNLSSISSVYLISIANRPGPNSEHCDLDLT